MTYDEYHPKYQQESAAGPFPKVITCYLTPDGEISGYLDQEYGPLLQSQNDRRQPSEKDRGGRQRRIPNPIYVRALVYKWISLHARLLSEADVHVPSPVNLPPAG